MRNIKLEYFIHKLKTHKEQNDLTNLQFLHAEVFDQSFTKITRYSKVEYLVLEQFYNVSKAICLTYSLIDQ